MIALFAGALSFLRPSVLPIVPPYLAYMSGMSVTEMDQDAGARRRTIAFGELFRAGPVDGIHFPWLHGVAFGQLFLQNQDTFTLLAGLVVMVFGAHFQGIFRIGFLSREARIDAGDRVRLGPGRAYVRVWRLPSAGRRALALFWGPSCRWPHLNPRLRVADAARRLRLGTWPAVSGGRGAFPAPEGIHGLDAAQYGHH